MPSSGGNAGMITFDTHPDRYKHWRLKFEAPIAWLMLDVAEDGGLQPGYKLKLNSYDLGVDIELHDALQRIRFEHPEIRSVVVTSGKERMFCAGANIYMLSTSSHAWKVNFCKFTNETRNGIEDSSRHSGLKFLAAVNGACAGGGYELALACDEILMIDDRSTTVSLPEVPLLGVLPGTGGLTRLVDKRGVRRDLADLFCTTAEGVRAERAKAWNLVDDSAPPQRFPEKVTARAQELAAQSDRPADARGITLTPLNRRIDETGYHYEYVDVELSAANRTATITVASPKGAQPKDLDGILAAGAAWWPLAMARQLDDAILMLRANNLETGTLVMMTLGDPAAVLAADALMAAHRDNWFVRETINMLRRTLARLDVSSRSVFAVINRLSCFAGTLLELALAADRTYMLDATEGPAIMLGETNFGFFAEANGLTRLQTRFNSDEKILSELQAQQGKSLDAQAASKLGLVTVTPDELDWDDEIRLALEERASLSPDALTGMEASLRFAGQETLETKIFGRLSAWQNWIFIRPNAVGEHGALKLFGTGSKAQFNWERV
ncbi:MAG: benzoyl-CoA-dihydrodiol lyase [Alphaproteobacteria bacterium]|nr:benzoyl-CoA-dihydrodiol lyase [Alphaproteobacteria bacterium]